MTHLWYNQVKATAAVQGKFDAFVESTKAIGEKQIADNAATVAHSKEVIKNVADSYETDIDAIHAHYAAKLRDGGKNTGGSYMPPAAGSDKGNDAASAQCQVSDGSLEENAALDARELMAWHAWAIGNKIPVQ